MVKKICNFYVFLNYYIMANNIFIDFKDGINNFSAAERAKIGRSFREELQTYKIGGAIMKIVDSSSDKVPVYVSVMCQQARKKNFASEFEAECDKLSRQYIKTRPDVASKIKALRKVVMDNAK